MKAVTAEIVAGADSIDDMGLLRHGGMARLCGRADGMKIGRTTDRVAPARIPLVSSSTANLDLARASHLDTLLDDDPRLLSARRLVAR